MATIDDLCKLLQELKSDVKEMKSTINSVKDDISVIKSEQSNILDKQNLLEKKVETLDKQIGRGESAKNILLFQVTDDDEFNKNLLVNVQRILQQAEVEISELCLASVYRIGKNVGNRRIIIKLIAPRWKQLFFEKIDNFKRMGLGLSNDVPKEERAIIRAALKAKYILRSEGQQPILKGNELWLNDRRLTEQEISEILERQNEENIHSERGGKIETNPPFVPENNYHNTTQIRNQSIIQNSNITPRYNNKKRQAENSLENFIITKPRPMGPGSQTA